MENAGRSWSSFFFKYQSSVICANDYAITRQLSHTCQRLPTPDLHHHAIFEFGFKNLWYVQSLNEHLLAAGVGCAMVSISCVCLVPSLIFFATAFLPSVCPPFTSKCWAAVSTLLSAHACAGSNAYAFPSPCSFFNFWSIFCFSDGSEVDCVLGVAGSMSDSFGAADCRRFVRSCSLANSWRWSLTPTHLSGEAWRTMLQLD